jgi:hypothetical protein
VLALLTMMTVVLFNGKKNSEIKQNLEEKKKINK